MSLHAYQSARSRAETPRAAEARLLSQITGELMDAQAARLSGGALIQPLHRNREMWCTSASDCAAPGNALPETLRAQIISLALFVDRFTTEVMMGREKIETLIDLNRTIMEGLRAPSLVN
jgi:flagellar protein FlaF